MLASRTAAAAPSTAVILCAHDAEPHRVFVARSKNLGFDSGKILREALAALGLRGGGSPDLAYARSLELTAFRKVAIEIARRLEDEAGYFTRDVGPGPEFSHLYPDPLDKITAEALARVAAQALRPPPTLDLSHVTPIRYTVAEAMSTLEARMADFGRAATFREIVADCQERIHVVVRFLALLELYREGKVGLQQGQTFGEIEIEWMG